MPVVALAGAVANGPGSTVTWLSEDAGTGGALRFQPSKAASPIGTSPRGLSRGAVTGGAATCSIRATETLHGVTVWPVTPDVPGAAALAKGEPARTRGRRIARSARQG